MNNQEIFGNNSPFLGGGSGGNNKQKGGLDVYKRDAEQALSRAAEGMLAARRNQTVFYISEIDKGAVVKYYNLNYSQSFITTSLFLLIIASVLAWSTKIAFLAVIAVYPLFLWYNQDSFFMRFGRDVLRISTADKNELRDLIFRDQIDRDFVMNWAYFWGIASFFCGAFFTRAIFMKHDEESVVADLISNIDINNELSFYFVIIGIFPIILLKIKEVWA